jgi:hypothetical protein
MQKVQGHDMAVIGKLKACNASTSTHDQLWIVYDPMTAMSCFSRAASDAEGENLEKRAVSKLARSVHYPYA